MNKPIIRNIYILFFILLITGCRSNFMFTPSDPLNEKSLEGKWLGSPWQPDSTGTQLREDAFNNTTLNKTITNRVKRVLDGSTIVLENGETVRYIGSETPTIDEAFYEEAKSLNMILAHNKKIKLQFDIQGRDSKGRMLAYAFVEGIFINAELIKHGYAKFTPHPLNTTFGEQFSRNQNEAIRSRKGMWQYQ